MKKIIFNTGRYYGPEGQIIEATEHGNFDTCFSNPGEEQYIIFKDKTRNICGKILFCRLAQSDIMRAYDAGNYIDY